MGTQVGTADLKLKKAEMTWELRVMAVGDAKVDRDGGGNTD